MNDDDDKIRRYCERSNRELRRTKGERGPPKFFVQRKQRIIICFIWREITKKRQIRD